MPWQITTHAVGEEDGTTYPSGEEEVGPITRPGRAVRMMTLSSSRVRSISTSLIAANGGRR